MMVTGPASTPLNFYVGQRLNEPGHLPTIVRLGTGDAALFESNWSACLVPGLDRYYPTLKCGNEVVD